MNYKIRKATIDDVEDIVEIYHSLIGTPGCAWNEYYPSIKEAEKDIRENGLFCVCDNKKIIAIATVGKDEDLDELSCWGKEIKRPCDLFRVGVIRDFQNKGIASKLIRYIEDDVKKCGFDGIRFLVSKTNPSALALYNKLEYKCCGETNMYDIEWFCYEKKI